MRRHNDLHLESSQDIPKTLIIVRGGIDQEGAGKIAHSKDD
jgi:hypothetical protein